MDGESLSSRHRFLSVNPTDTFEDLYRRHSRAVLRYAMQCVSRPEIAEEIASEAFLALYRNLDRVDTSLLPAWLFTVVRNSAMSYWRRCIVERKYAPRMKERAQPASPEMMTWILDIPQLKPIHRTCLILRYVHEMERAEIARQLGLSENQVKGHLQYGLELLRRHIDGSRR